MNIMPVCQWDLIFYLNIQILARADMYTGLFWSIFKNTRFGSPFLLAKVPIRSPSDLKLGPHFAQNWVPVACGSSAKWEQQWLTKNVGVPLGSLGAGGIILGKKNKEDSIWSQKKVVFSLVALLALPWHPNNPLMILNMTNTFWKLDEDEKWNLLVEKHGQH